MEKDTERNISMPKEQGQIGEVRIADEVVASIAALAALEVDGVASMAGNATDELLSRVGVKGANKGAKVEVEAGVVSGDGRESEIRIQHSRGFGKDSGKGKECN